jgi:uncharacterized protein (DUF2147 family)
MRQKNSKALLALVLGCTVAVSAFAGSSAMNSTAHSDAQGHWITESGNLEVDIEPCGAALCGTVVKVLGNRSMSHPGETLHAVDTRPALGMKILTDFTAAGNGEWKGQIYNRENGKTYDCMLSLDSADHLKVHAYKFITLFGKTQIWTRAVMPAAH